MANPHQAPQAITTHLENQGTTMSNYLKFKLYFIDGVVINHKLNTTYTYDIDSTYYSWKRGLFINNIESGGWYDVVGGNHMVYFNGLDNYTTNFLRPPSIENG